MGTDEKYEKMPQRISELQQELDSCRIEIKRLREPEQKCAEEALIENKEKYRKLIEGLNEAIYCMSLPTGRYEYFSPAAKLVFGYSSEEFLNNPLLIKEIIHPDFMVYFEDRWRELLHGKVAPLYEYKILDPTGRERWITQSNTGVFDDNGTLVAIEGVCRDNTEHKTMEEALRHSEDTARALLNASPEAAFLIELDGTVITSNAVTAQRMGARIEDIVGKSIYQFLPTDVAESRKKRVEEVIRTAKPVRFEDRRSGMIVDQTVYPVLDDQGDVFKIAIFARDVTDRRRSQEALRESEEKYRSLFENAQDAIFVADPQTGILLDVNQSAEKLTGFSRKELVGKHQTFIHPSDDSKFYHQEFCKSAERQGSKFTEMLIQTKGGRHVPVEISSGGTIRLGGKRVHIGIFRDITDRKQKEKALRESEERFRDLVEMLPEAVFEADLEMNLNFANKRALALFGYTQQDMEKGLNGYDMLVPEDRKRALNNTERRLEGEKLEAVEYQGVKKDGTTFPVLLHASPIVHNGIVKGVRGVIVDMSERRQMENRLRQTQKMQAIGTLAGGIAHDFNNILTPVIIQTELALLNTADDGPLRNSLQEVLEAGYRAKSLVKQILTFSREAETKKTPLVVAPIVKEALKLLRSTLPTTIRIEKQLEEETGNVLADPTQIHQVLMNLCTNAAHAMRETGGVLKVSLSEIDVDGDAAQQHQSIDPGRYVRLTVADTGHGIDPSLKERIFEPFFTTKDRAEGTGMGLSVVHGIVKSYDGSISVESGVDQGSTFTILLPSVESTEQSVSIQDEDLPVGNEQVLVVDDEIAMVKALEAMLTQLGYRVVSRTSSMEALEEFKAAPEDYSLVITDQTMPNMTGVELARALLQVRKDLPIILCTGFSDLVDEEKAKQEGIKEFILKPIIMKDMARTVRTLLDG